MPVDPTPSSTNKVVTLAVAERLDFSAHRRFCDAAEQAAGDCDVRVVVDLEQTQAVHDSGIGLLLMLRRRLRNPGASIDLVNCSPGLRQLLIARSRSGAFQVAES
jgi:anti-anti-sigma regulatory factor